MLLVVPLGHLTQQEMWRGPAIEAVANLAVQIGLDQCPEGFRLLSNFGPAAHQSQPHAPPPHRLGDRKRPGTRPREPAPAYPRNFSPPASPK